MSARHVRVFSFAAIFWVAALALTARPIAAQQSSRIVGQVTETGGTPIAGVTVSVEGTPLVVESSADGSFVLDGVTPGRRRVAFDRLGYASRRLSVTLVAAETERIDLTLDPRPIAMKGLTVIGSPEELAEVRRRMARIPGGVDLIETEELRRSRQAHLKDVLRFTPGVWAQPRFGAADESQLSIRGSGLRNNFHLRGVNILVNGMPYRNADGFTDFESLELLTTSNVQVYKGANALRFGGSTLGGAINLETKTGYTAEPAHGFFQGGSYGFAKGQVSSGGVAGDLDWYGSYAHTSLDGFRSFADQRRDRANAHLGWVISPRVDVRGFYFFAYVEEDLPGSLTREEFRADPGQADPTNVENRWGRDYTLHHVGVQLRAQLTPDQRIDVSPYGQFRDILHPIFRVLDQVSRDYGLEVRYDNTAPLGGRESRFTVGLQPAWGQVDNRHFENVGGERGELTKDQRENAGSVALYAEEVLGLTPRLSAVLGFRFDHAWREADDFLLEDGDQSDRRGFDEVMPRVGFLYELPAVDGQLFGNVSRSFEPPLLLELNSLTIPGFVELDGQSAWQFEVGTRGSAGGWTWQVAAYDIELEDEILNVNVRPLPDAPFTVPTYRNAPATRHAGLEAGLSWTTSAPVFTPAGRGDRAGFRLAYTLADYAYVDDPEFEGNDIPGAPGHALNAEIVYEHPVGLTFRPGVEWIPDDYFVDSANTVENDGWTAVNLRADWAIGEIGATAFVEGRNLTDVTYAGAVTVDDAAGRFFLPADGRSLYAGIHWSP